MTSMFSYEEAIQFLETNWGLKNVQRRLSEDKHDLLDDIVCAVQARLPFQNLSLMATPPQERRRPSLTQIKNDCTSGLGGLCYTLNVFTFCLLRALNYDAALCHATCTATVRMADNHVFVVVRDLDRPGDSFLVETGVGFPTFRAITLDFDDESPVFVDDFLEYKYIRRDNLLLRMHRKGDNAPRPQPPRPDIDFYVGEWRRFYFSDLKCVEKLEAFESCFDVVYTDPKASNFHSSPRALWFPEQRACILSAYRVFSERDGSDVIVVQSSDAPNDDTMIECYKKYFPQISEDILRGAYLEWRRVRPH